MVEIWRGRKRGSNYSSGSSESGTQYTLVEEKYSERRNKVNANYIKNTDKLLATQHQDVPFWQRMYTSYDMIQSAHVYIQCARN
jgi:hypothetical protein